MCEHAKFELINGTMICVSGCAKDMPTCIADLRKRLAAANARMKELETTLAQEKKIGEMWCKKYNRSADQETVLFHQYLQANQRAERAEAENKRMREALEALAGDVFATAPWAGAAMRDFAREALKGTDNAATEAMK